MAALLRRPLPRMAVLRERSFTSDALTAVLNRMHIFRPNEVQQTALEAAATGQSVLCVSQTGSGKTLTFLLPMIERLRCSDGASACICIAPSPELAAQHADVAHSIVSHLGADAPAVICRDDEEDGRGGGSGGGGEPQLPVLIVSSAPGALEAVRAVQREGRRLLAVAIDEVDAILCGAAHDEHLSQSGAALLDEIGVSTPDWDREMDASTKAFAAAAATAAAIVTPSPPSPPSTPQLLMTTALLTREHDAALGRRLPSSVVRVEQKGPADGGARGTLAPSLRQVFHYCSAATKDAKLLAILAKQQQQQQQQQRERQQQLASPSAGASTAAAFPSSADGGVDGGTGGGAGGGAGDGGGTLIFCKDAAQVARVRRVLLRAGGGIAEGDICILTDESAAADRARALRAFRDGRHRLLLATGVAARGLDLPSLQLCVLFDMPNDVAGYVHAAGRTARRGREGVVCCLVESHAQAKHFRALHALQAAQALQFAAAGTE